MKTMFKTLAALLLTASVSLPVQARTRGGGTDGGSNGAVLGDKLILLDLFVENPSFNDDYRQTEKRNLVVKKAPKFKASNLPDFVARPHEQAAFQYANAKLNAWNQNSVVVKFVRQSMASMYFWVEDEVPTTNGYVIPDSIKNAYPQLRIESIAYYSDEVFGAVLSRPQWNRLGLISQAGVLIHEALRHIQNRDRKVFSQAQDALPLMQDKTLQDLTAKILRGPRSANDNLDSMQGIGSSLEFVREFNIPQTRESALQEICADLQHLEALTVSNLKKYMSDKQNQHKPLTLLNLCKPDVPFFDDEDFRMLYISALFNANYLKHNQALLSELGVRMKSRAPLEERRNYGTLIQDTYIKVQKFALNAIFTGNMDQTRERELFKLKNGIGD